MKIIIAENYEKMSKIAADMVKEVMTEKSNAVLGLATGSTPVGLYKELIRMNKENEIDFSKITTVNLDEYIGLSGTHDQSYRYFMNKNLFDHININKASTFVPNGLAVDTKAEAENYDKRIEELGGIDIQIMGVGANGHIAFNEPDSMLSAGTHVVELTENTIEANSRFFASKDDVPKYAMTMGLAPIMKSKKIVVLVNGTNKAEALRGLFEGKIVTSNPVTMLLMHRDVTVIIPKEVHDLI